VKITGTPTLCEFQAQKVNHIAQQAPLLSVELKVRAKEIAKIKMEKAGFYDAL